MLKLNRKMIATRNWSKVIGFGILFLAIAFTGAGAKLSGVASAQRPAQATQDGIFEIIAREKQAIVGSWNVPDPEGIPTLITFNSDGSLVESDVDHTFCSGHGSWTHLGGTQFAYTWIQYKKDDQEQKGFVTVFGTVNLTSDRNQFSGPLHFEFSCRFGNSSLTATFHQLSPIFGNRS